MKKSTHLDDTAENPTHSDATSTNSDATTPIPPLFYKEYAVPLFPSLHRS